MDEDGDTDRTIPIPEIIEEAPIPVMQPQTIYIVEPLSATLIYNKITVTGTLTQDRFHFEHKSKSATILYSTMFAVHMLKDRVTFAIYAVDMQHDSRLIQEFTCSSHEECVRWINELHHAIFNVPKQVEAPILRERNLLVLLNPNSGKKKGKHIFEKQVKPILDCAHLKYTLVVTNRALHAQTFCKDPTNLDINIYTEVVTIGGDGILYEAINGVMERPDWQECIQKLKFGVIPAGTGNGLATVIGARPKGKKACSALQAAFIVARGFYSPLDLMSVFQNDKRTFAFLSVTWAAIADVDLGTENMRWMGSTRNLVGAVKSILGHKYYQGRVKYVEATDYKKVEENIRRGSHSRDEAPVQVGAHTTVVDGPPCSLLVQNLAEEFQKISPTHFTKNQQIQNEMQVQAHSPVQEIEDKFFLFVVTNITHLAHDFIASPAAHMHDGVVDLVMIRNQLSRTDLMKLLGDTETGKYADSQHVEMHKVKAFAFYPIDQGSYIAVDGEQLDYAPLICEVHPGLLNIFTL